MKDKPKSFLEILLNPKLSIAFGVAMFIAALIGMKMSSCGSWECMALWSRICAVLAASVPVGWALGLIAAMIVNSISKPRTFL
jgi:hypothetical protein